MRSLIFTLSLMAAAPASAADKLSLVLDWFINPDHGPIIVAQEMGYFSDEDLEVEIIPPADPSVPPKLAAAGKVDLAISYQPQLHMQVAEGLPLKRVGTLIATPLNCLMVADDGPIKEIADLKGRKIGFSVAGVEEAMLTTILGSAGLALEDVELINVNFSLAPSVLSGQVDAAMGAVRGFEPNQMAIEGQPGRCFFVEEHGIPTYDELIYVANPELMDADKLSRFLRATEKAVNFITNHPDEGWEVFSGYAPELQDELNALAWPEIWPRFALRPAALDVGRYAGYEAFLSEAGLIEGMRDVSDLAVDLGAQ
ncbi:ABC transporter substrate-binding protein [Tropicimonas marinistellae]|uniref:ABC transporter substrate-binding protein n=1 Tax=Tropicimonas marinistellae TaxID=1739787 RepID=UPI0008367D9A|nr:ABC transporter substrate-binding protein [Tropicimonas marinistellae]